MLRLQFGTEANLRSKEIKNRLKRKKLSEFPGRLPDLSPFHQMFTSHICIFTATD